jgi:hypothetical protein
MVVVRDRDGFRLPILLSKFGGREDLLPNPDSGATVPNRVLLRVGYTVKGDDFKVVMIRKKLVSEKN